MISTQEVDKKLQRKLFLKNFVASEGYAEAKASFIEHLEGIKAQIEELHQDSIEEKKLAKLNYLLGIKIGLERASHVLEGFEEELLDA